MQLCVIRVEDGFRLVGIDARGDELTQLRRKNRLGLRWSQPEGDKCFRKCAKNLGHV